MKLITTMKQFEGAHAALAKLRRGSTMVKIDAATLFNLLRDHSRLCATLRGEVVTD